MSKKPCGINLRSKETIEELFGKEYAERIPKQLIEEWASSIEAIKSQMDKGEVPLDKPEFFRRVNDYLEQARKNSEIEIVDRSNQQMAEARYFKQIMNAKDPKEGALAMISVTRELQKNGMNSIEGANRGKEAQLIERFIERLKSKGVFDLVASKKFDLEISAARRALALGEDTSKLDPQIKEAAKIMNSQKNIEFHEYKSVGAPINYKQNYQFKQTHDPNKIREAGFEQWKNDMIEWGLETKNVSSPKDIEKRGLDVILREGYEEFIRGKFAGAERLDLEGRITGIDIETSISKQTAAKRAYNFTSPDGAMKYKLKYGNSESLLESMLTDMKGTALKVTLYERLGPKPLETANKTIDRAIGELLAAGDLKKADRLKGNKSFILASLKNVMGSGAEVGSEATAMYGKWWRESQVLSKLWNTGLRSLGNPANVFMNLAGMRGGDGTFKGDTKALAKNLADTGWLFVSNLPGAVKATTGKLVMTPFNKQVANDWADSLMLANQFLARETRQGWGKYSGFLIDVMMDASGLNAVNLALDRGMQAVVMKQFADIADTPWAKLGTQEQASIMQMGFDEFEWSVFKHAKRQDFDKNGKPAGPFILAPEAFKSPEALKEIENVMAIKGIKGDPKKIAHRMETSFLSFLHQLSASATTTAPTRASTASAFGTQPGTRWGEIARNTMQFKSFTFAGVVQTRKYGNQFPDPKALAEGRLEAKRGSRAYANMATYGLLATALPYIANSMYQYASGKQRDELDEFDTYAKSLAQGPMGGFYMDVATGPWDKYSWGETLGGPMIGSLSTAARAFTQSKNSALGPTEEKRDRAAKDAAMTATKLIRNNIPFQQAPYIKAALTYAENQVVREYLYGEGTNAKYEAKLAREEMRKALEEGIDE